MSTATLSIDESARPRCVSPLERAPQPIIELQKVCKGYGGASARTEVLTDVNLRIREGEFLAIVGFSGSGKTTLMKLLAGLTMPDQGQVLMRGESIKGPAADRGLVFQNYSLLPWLTVLGNVLLAVDRVYQDRSKSERRDIAMKYIEMVSLGPAVDKRPHELSGGMRQRVSLARTLSTNPEVLLLDEPLSALDALTRSVLQEEILRMWERDRKTCVLITNDVDEAILLADRIVPLNPGPNAAMGPAFTVQLDRPRDKTGLNHNDYFKGLRNAVTNYMVAVRKKSRDDEAAETEVPLVERPNIKPADLRKVHVG